MAEPTPRADGFEYRGEFYRWSVTDTGKDIMLIDRITGMSLADFYEVVDDDAQRGRGPILLALIATSIRASRPDWSVERIFRLTQELSISELTFLEADVDEEDEARPPALAAAETPPPSGEHSDSPSNGSSPSLTPLESTDSEMSYGSPV